MSDNIAIEKANMLFFTTDKERAVNIMCKYKEFISYFSLFAFSDEYIDVTEKYCEFLQLNFDTSYLDPRVYKIHPLLYRMLINNKDIFFEIDEKLIAMTKEYFEILYETSLKIEVVTKEKYVALNVFETVE